ncbi:hypothetical protein [Brachyspira innocens]|uniref:hypothetical protein n=1 Tax=Brachyspira innocens TaxID=13264 RepID=UPI000363A03F|nr:hypothetical protein [Brachyspira innocens]
MKNILYIIILMFITIHIGFAQLPTKRLYKLGPKAQAFLEQYSFTGIDEEYVARLKFGEEIEENITNKAEYLFEYSTLQDIISDNNVEFYLFDKYDNPLYDPLTIYYALEDALNFMFKHNTKEEIYRAGYSFIPCVLSRLMAMVAIKNAACDQKKVFTSEQVLKAIENTKKYNDISYEEENNQFYKHTTELFEIVVQDAITHNNIIQLSRTYLYVTR